MAEHNDWRQMEAGPELDAFIAERAGLQLYRRGYAIWAKLPNGYVGPTPPYSTDLNAAITLLDSTGQPWRVSSQQGAQGITKYTVEIPWNHGPLILYPRVAEAAVKAWLEWKERDSTAPTKRTFGSAPGVEMAPDFDDIGYEESEE